MVVIVASLVKKNLPPFCVACVCTNSCTVSGKERNESWHAAFLLHD